MIASAVSGNEYSWHMSTCSVRLVTGDAAFFLARLECTGCSGIAMHCAPLHPGDAGQRHARGATVACTG
jgi:hypothetical protein